MGRSKFCATDFFNIMGLRNKFLSSMVRILAITRLKIGKYSNYNSVVVNLEGSSFRIYE